MENLEYFKEHSDIFEVAKHKREDLYMIGLKNDKSVDWRTVGATDVGGIVMDNNSNIITRTYGKIFELDELDSNGLMKMSGIKSRDNNVRMEKLDGHLVAISQYKGKLLFTTKTGFDGRLLHKAKMWFNKNLTPMQKRAVKDLTINNTLLFDFVSPSETVFIEYPKEDLILHGILNTKSGSEIFEKHVFETIAKSIGVDIANRFEINHEMLMRIVKQDFEEDVIRGLVTRTKEGKRFSIETDEYKRRKGLIL